MRTVDFYFRVALILACCVGAVVSNVYGSPLIGLAFVSLASIILAAPL
jgi:hypothetical protein